jgi:hypothetical protein
MKRLIKRAAKCFMGYVHAKHVALWGATLGRDAGTFVGGVVAGPPGAATGAMIGAAVGLLIVVGLAAIYTFGH